MDQKAVALKAFHLVVMMADKKGKYLVVWTVESTAEGKAAA